MFYQCLICLPLALRTPNCKRDHVGLVAPLTSKDPVPLPVSIWNATLVQAMTPPSLGYSKLLLFFKQGSSMFVSCFVNVFVARFIRIATSFRRQTNRGCFMCEARAICPRIGASIWVFTRVHGVGSWCTSAVYTVRFASGLPLRVCDAGRPGSRFTFILRARLAWVALSLREARAERYRTTPGQYRARNPPWNEACGMKRALANYRRHWNHKSNYTTKARERYEREAGKTREICWKS
jgi:hypothetical protein